MDITKSVRCGLPPAEGSRTHLRKQPGCSRNGLPVVPSRVVCKASAAEDASNAARQARFLQEIDKLAEARRLESSRRRTPVQYGNSTQRQTPTAEANTTLPSATTADTSPSSISRSNSGAQQQVQSGGMQRAPRSGVSSKHNADADAGHARQSDRRFVRVKFVLHLHIDYGQRIKVLGSDLMLGGWSMQHAPELQWSEGDRWHVSVDLPANGIYEYKYVIVGSDGMTVIQWQRGNNCVLAIKADDDRVEVYDNWEGQPGAAVIANGQSATRETRLQTWATQMDALAGSQRAELRRTRMELAAAQEDARGARADVSRLKATLARTQTDMVTAERKIREMERTNQLLRAQLAESSLTFHKAFETAQRLLSKERQWLPSSDPDNSDASVSSSTSFSFPTMPPAPSALARRKPELTPPAVDVNDSLEFLSMLGRTQFAFRGRLDDEPDEEADALADVDAQLEHDDVAARAAEGVAAAAAEAVCGDSKGLGVSNAMDETASSVVTDAVEAGSIMAENDTGSSLSDSSDAPSVRHNDKNGSYTRMAREGEGISARGRASVSAVQGFIARIRQGLGVRREEPRSPATPAATASANGDDDDSVSSAAAAEQPEAHKQQELVVEARVGLEEAEPLQEGSPDAMFEDDASSEDDAEQVQNARGGVAVGNELGTELHISKLSHGYANGTGGVQSGCTEVLAADGTSFVIGNNNCDGHRSNGDAHRMATAESASSVHVN